MNNDKSNNRIEDVYDYARYSAAFVSCDSDAPANFRMPQSCGQCKYLRYVWQFVSSRQITRDRRCTKHDISFGTDYNAPAHYICDDFEEHEAIERHDDDPDIYMSE